MQTAFISGSSSMLQGGGRYRFGPAKLNGEQRSLKMGSAKME
jgi:hypothetical protein